MPSHKTSNLERSTTNNIEQEYRLKPLRVGEADTTYFKHNLSALVRADATARANYYKAMTQIEWASICVMALEEINGIGPAGDERYIPVNMMLLSRVSEITDAQIASKLKWHSLAEVPGAANNPYILAQAGYVGATSYYHTDATPWCALEMSYWVKSADDALPRGPLAAKSWRTWGTKVSLGEAGDVLVLDRPGGQHVTMYVGQIGNSYACLGGNQGDKVCIALFIKPIFKDVRRSPWKLGQSASVWKISLNSSGPVATSTVQTRKCSGRILPRWDYRQGVP